MPPTSSNCSSGFASDFKAPTLSLVVRSCTICSSLLKTASGSARPCVSGAQGSDQGGGEQGKKLPESLVLLNQLGVLLGSVHRPAGGGGPHSRAVCDYANVNSRPAFDETKRYVRSDVSVGEPELPALDCCAPPAGGQSCVTRAKYNRGPTSAGARNTRTPSLVFDIRFLQQQMPRIIIGDLSPQHVHRTPPTARQVLRQPIPSGKLARAPCRGGRAF